MTDLGSALSNISTRTDVTDTLSLHWHLRRAGVPAFVCSAHEKWLHGEAQHWLILSEKLRFGGREPLRQGVSRTGSRLHHKGGTELGHSDKYKIESKPTQMMISAP